MTEQLNLALATHALSRAPFGIAILDGGGRIIWINQALEQLFGVEGKQLIGHNEDSIDPAYRSPLFDPEETLFLEATDNRSARWVQTWRRRSEAEVGAIGTTHYYADISALQDLLEDRARLSEELALHTTRDSVTGLPNRRALLQSLEPLVSRSRRYHNPLGVIRMRLENLKEIDADHGVGSGDRALIAISQLLKDQIRWADLVGRYDNDEFLLILPETADEAAKILTEKLQERISSLEIKGADEARLKVVLRWGTAAWVEGDDRARLLRRAREALDKS